MNQVLRASLAVVSLALLSACGEPMSEEQKRLLQQDKEQVTRQLNLDLENNARSFVKGCISHIEGRAFDDAALRTAPFRATKSGGKTFYLGEWSGKHGYEVNKQLMTLTAAGCDFRFLTTQDARSSGWVFTRPAPVVDEELRKAGYTLTAFKPVTAGGTFASASLNALVPGPTYRVREGTMQAKKGGKSVTIRIFLIKQKGSHAPLYHLMRVAK